MTLWLPALLAGAAAAVACTPRGPGGLRLDAIAPTARQRRPASPMALAAIGVAAYLVVGLPAALLALAAAVALDRTVRGRRRAAAAELERARALDALALLGADLRAGRAPAAAFSAAAEVACGESADALAAAAVAAGIGGDVAAALTIEGSALAPTWRALAACWQVCSEAGTGLAAAVLRLEQALRAGEAQRRAVAAELAGPRATAQLLAALPIVGVALAAALGARPLQVLLGTPLGLACLTIGIALDVLGLLWTQRLTARALP